MSTPPKTLLRAAVFFGVCVTALAVYYSFHSFYDETRGKRRAAARSHGAPIGIAVVWPHSETMSTIERGVRLAADEINTAGGVDLVAADGSKDTRLLAVRTFEEAGEDEVADYVRGHWKEPRKTRRVRGKIAHDHGVIAVIGHYSTPDALIASITYEENGILFFQPVLTASALTAHGFKKTFRTIPSDAEFAAALVRTALARGFLRIGVLSARAGLAGSLALEIDRQIGHNAIDCGGNETRASLAFEISYPLDTVDFRPLAERIARKYTGSFDCLILTDRLPRAGALMKQLRAFGIDQPILAGPTLDTPTLWDAAPEVSNGVLVASIFAFADPSTPMATAFSNAYRGLYKEPPDLRAAQSYEAVKLLAQALERGGSADPVLVATSLRSGGSFQALSGSVEFDDSGAVKGKHIFIKEMRRGLFRVDPEPTPGPGCQVVTERNGVYAVAADSKEE